jgi:hypothetical protein
VWFRRNAFSMRILGPDPSSSLRSCPARSG